jgi:8-oxo-dGTP diphosphatase
MKKYHSIICATYLLPEKENKVLLLRRFNTGYEDGNYSLVAGHVDEGESVIQTMVREAKEEAGMGVHPEDLELVHVMHRRKVSDDNRIDFFFKCRAWEGVIQNMEPHKCDDLNWFSLNELPENIINYIRVALELIDKEQTYSNFGWEE